MADASSFFRFQALLSDIFQFDTGDLDFGIYRILNAKRTQIETFLTTDLQAVVDQAFAQYAATKSDVAADDLAEARKKVLDNVADDAFDTDGQLKPQHHGTKVGKEFLAKAQAASHVAATESLKAKVYNDLLTFFSRYYDDGDFIPLRRAGREMTYAIPYNGEEVTLYWANKGQYYIKTDDRLATYRFSAGSYHVALEIRSAKTELNNNKGAKRYYILAVSDAEDGDAVFYDDQTKTLHIAFAHRPFTADEESAYGKTETQKPQTKLNGVTYDAVVSRVSELALRAALTAPYSEANPAPTLLRHLNQFTRKNTSDFFIHKNLSAFLTSELDQYIKTECLRLDDLLNGSEGDFALQTARGRATKAVGEKIIALLSSVEDFQKRLFEKRKFVLRTDYVFTLDRVPQSLHAQVLENKAQLEEWADLYDVHRQQTADSRQQTGGLTAEALQSEPLRRLPIDTRHFDAKFKAELLASVDNLYMLTDGVLFNSENLQALALITETYRERVKCIYIDPPYNAKTSEILYKNTFKHTAWLTLIADRIAKAHDLLHEDGVFIIAIDEVEQEYLGILLNELFPSFAKTCVSVVHNPSGQQGDNFSYTHDYAYFLYPKAGTSIGKDERSEAEADVRNFRDVTGDSSLRTSGATCFYPIYVKDGIVQGFGDVCADDFHPASINLPDSNGVIAVYPIDPKGIERKWRFARDTVEAIKQQLYPHYLDKRCVWDIKRNKTTFNQKTVWNESRYSANNHGTQVLNDMLGPEKAPESLYPKSIHTVMDAIRAALNGETNSIILDYFGGSGTTGDAIIRLNRGMSKCKYVLVEMGVYFDTILMRRLKKSAFSSAWKDGKPTSQDSVSQTIKYHTLEQYEDTLNNLQLRPEAESQRALDVFGEDYLLRYLLDFDTQGSPSLLNVTQLNDPLNYALRIRSGDDFENQTVDLPETFSYLLGLQVRKIRALIDGTREYRAVLGSDRSGRQIAHIWRKSSDLAGNERLLKQDATFIKATALPALSETTPDRIFINGAFAGITNAENCEPELFRLMFAGVGA